MDQFSLRAWFLNTTFGRISRYFKNLCRGFFVRVSNKLRGFDDFFHFPFDISKPMPSTANNVLKDLIVYMNLERIEYWLAEGTLLGIVRDGQLIPHDTDLDFYLTDALHIEKIQDFLHVRGFKVGRLLKFRGKETQITFYDENELLIDFLVWKESNGQEFHWFGPEIKGKRAQDSHFFHPATYIKWQNIEVRTFNNFVKWLEIVYGEGWKIPELKKSDWTKSIGDLR